MAVCFPFKSKLRLQEVSGEAEGICSALNCPPLECPPGPRGHEATGRVTSRPSVHCGHHWARAHTCSLRTSLCTEWAYEPSMCQDPMLASLFHLGPHCGRLQRCPADAGPHGTKNPAPVQLPLRALPAAHQPGRLCPSTPSCRRPTAGKADTRAK